MSYILKFCIIFRACVVSLPSNLEGRIVKGYKVNIERYPFSVFLHFHYDIPSACGSSLIMDRAVVTAAHCLNELKHLNGRIKAFVGSTVPLYSSILRHVVRYRVHPKFNPSKGRHNLGVAFLNDRVPLGSNVQKIPIATKLPQPNDILFTSGWGKEVPKKFPDYSDERYLKASKQRLIAGKECEKFTGYQMSPAYWCTVAINGYHYHGDSGNGLVTNDKFLVGVVSYMINEATIYSDVTQQQRWIKESLTSIIKENC